MVEIIAPRQPPGGGSIHSPSTIEPPREVGFPELGLESSGHIALLPVFSSEVWGDESVQSRVQQLMASRFLPGSPYSFTHHPRGGEWVARAGGGEELCLAGRPVHFWVIGGLRTFTLMKNLDGRCPSARLTLDFIVDGDREGLYGLLQFRRRDSTRPDVPSIIRALSFQPGTSVAERLYDARADYWASSETDPLSYFDFNPGDLVALKCRLVQTSRGFFWRGLDAQAMLLLSSGSGPEEASSSEGGDVDGPDLPEEWLV